MPRKLTGVGKGTGVKKPSMPKIKMPEMFSPSQQKANAKALEAVKGIGENIKTATNVFIKQKKR